MRRCARILVGLLLISLAAACGGGGGPSAFQVVTKAGAATAGAGPARMAMRVESGSVTVTVTGVADLEHKVMEAETQLPSVGTMKIVTSGTTAYLQLPAAAQKQLGVATPWVSIDQARAQEAVAGLTGGAGTNDPSDALATLQGAADKGVQKVGTETLRDVKTTHYRADVDLAKAAEAKGTITDPAKFQRFVQALGTKTATEDVWVDGQGVARKLAMRLTVRGVTSTFTTELYDFGKVQSPTPPPPSQVTDITDKAIAQAQRRQAAAGSPPS
jgi:hypothetical protein